MCVCVWRRRKGEFLFPAATGTHTHIQERNKNKRPFKDDGAVSATPGCCTSPKNLHLTYDIVSTRTSARTMHSMTCGLCRRLKKSFHRLYPQLTATAKKTFFLTSRLLGPCMERKIQQSIVFFYTYALHGTSLKTWGGAKCGRKDLRTSLVPPSSHQKLITEREKETCKLAKWADEEKGTKAKKWGKDAIF